MRSVVCAYPVVSPLITRMPAPRLRELLTESTVPSSRLAEVLRRSSMKISLKPAPVDRPFRVGGMVEKGSLKRRADGITVDFVVTDGARSVPVRYSGLLPDLFREGKGVVAQGRLGADGIFHADQVLAKHDENYMPPEVKDALKKTHDGKASAAAGAAS